jgi:signal transduction histidine kinase
MDAHEIDRRSPDQPLLRKTRLRFLAWSAIYAAVAASLGDAAIDQLRSRASEMGAKAAIGSNVFFPSKAAAGVVSDPAQPGVVFGGATSGTLGMLVMELPDGSSSARAPVPGILPDRAASDSGFVKNPESGAIALAPVDPAGLAAAQAGRTVINEMTVDGTPLRVLSQSFVTAGTTFLVQVIGDRTSEQRTLGVLLTVLAGGSLLVLMAALAVGYVLSGRALVPIRESLRRQRAFAADASHELRTPLAIVRTSLEHLRRHPDAQVADVGGTIDDIDAGVTRLTDLVDELLLLARADSGAAEIERSPVELAEIALEAVDGLSGLAAAREAHVDLEVEPIELVGDPARLRQLMSLLVDNALRYGPAGQRVVVRLRATPGRATIEVDDGGPGIAPADLPHLFERFYRGTGAPPGGTGLGLAIAEWIVDRHGGTIRAENLATGGARFSVSLPA